MVILVILVTLPPPDWPPVFLCCVKCFCLQTIISSKYHLLNLSFHSSCHKSPLTLHTTPSCIYSSSPLSYTVCCFGWQTKNRSICATYKSEVPKCWWETPSKVVENNRAKILWEFNFKTDKQLLTNEPDMVVVDKEQKTAAVIDVTIPAHSISNSSKKYQRLREQLEQMRKVKSEDVLVVIEALGAVTPKLGQWLHQIPGT